MATIKNTQKEFANYLRKIEKPSDWNVKLLGEFPGTFTNYQRYFELILKENKNTEKIEALNSQYDLQKYETIQRKVEVINGQPRSIQNFFNGIVINKGTKQETKKNTLPHEKKMEFIAILFNAPIKTLNEFIEYQDKQADIKIRKSEKEELEILKDEEKVEEIEILQNKKNENKRNKLKLVISSFYKKIKKNTAIISSAAFILLLFNLVLFYQTTKAEASDLEAQAIGKRVLAAAFFPKDMGDTLFVHNTSNDPTSATKIRTSADENIVLFQTERIYNDKFIHKNGVWSFKTDPKGEDMYSKTYGGLWSEKIKPSIDNMLNGRTPIANERIFIKFRITNNSNNSLYFDELLVGIVDTFDNKVERGQYNVYKTRATTKLFTIQFDGSNVYGGFTEKEEIKPGKMLFCQMEITGNEACNDLIYQFDITVNLTDGTKDYKQTSDKNYFIGFVKP